MPDLDAPPLPAAPNALARGVLVLNALFLASLFLASLLLAPGPAMGRDAALPFCPGERLEFSLRWASIPAGEAVLEVMPPATVEGLPASHLRMTASTNAFVDVFYTVRDQVDAYVAPDLSRTLRYEKHQREGHYERDIVVRFFWDRSQAQYSNQVNGPKEPILILPGTLDPLSVFFGFRATDIRDGADYSAPVTDGVKCVIGSAKVIGRETVSVPAGEFDCFVVAPELEHVGGVFRKSPDAGITVWVTADERHMPVMVSSKVVVGRFSAVLTGFERPECRPVAEGGHPTAP